MLGDIDMTITGTRVEATVTLGADTLLSETYYPVSGRVTIHDLRSLVEPRLTTALVGTLTVAINEQTYDSQSETYSQTDTQTVSSIVYLCTAEISTPPDDFYASRFATLMTGPKRTTLERKESVWYYSASGHEVPKVVAQYYDDGEFTMQTFTLPVQLRAGYNEVNASAANYTAEGKTLVRYYVDVNGRRQTYVIDHTCQEGSPALAFRNAFGLFEVIYCRGTEAKQHDYDRQSANLLGLYRNYRIEETVTHHADTGPLSPMEREWATDLFRSTDVWLLRKGDRYKAVAITDSQVESDDSDDAIIRYTFDYRLSQRNHNLFNPTTVSSIFDATFDPSFE